MLRGVSRALGDVDGGSLAARQRRSGRSRKQPRLVQAAGGGWAANSPSRQINPSVILSFIVRANLVR